MTRNVRTEARHSPERYEPPGSSCGLADLNRRQAMQILGAGLLVSVVEEISVGQRARGRPRRAEKLVDRLHIGTDGAITVMTGKVEVGQGSRTSLTQAVAEEMRVSVDQVWLVMADTAVVPDDGITAGSRTTPATSPVIRKAAATARELLVNLAARRWRTSRDSLVARDGKIVDRAGKREVTYGELAADKDFTKELDRKVDDGVTVTPVSEWRVLGTPAPRVNTVSIVTGAHRYPSDMVRPGMLYGKLLRPPSFGATLTSVDLGPARSMEGVTVVRDGEFVGCAAPTSAQAQAAIEAIGKTARWNRPPHPSSEDVFAYLKAHAHAGESSRRGRGARSRGSIDKGLAGAKKVLRGTYQTAYIAHAPLEPRSALAEWQDGKVTVWTGSQGPNRVHSQLARELGVSSRHVRVIVPDTGGGFGGKHSGETAVEAARLARAVGRAVSLTWTRQEEFTWAYFRPAALIEIQAGLDEHSAVVAWDFTTYNAGSAAIATPYDIPNTRTRSVGCDSPMRQGSYRCLAATANVFARESFMDELAAAAKSDPLEFRLKHLGNERLRAVLASAAKRFDWKRRRKTKRPPGRGIGMSCATEKASYTAACVEVEVDRDRGGLKVLEVCEAFECGAIHNPANLRSQVQGCIIMGLGGALREAIEFRDGQVLNPSFARYAVPRFADVPKIETILLNRPDIPSAGGGETPIVAIAPAIGNAVFEATGHRARAMPIKLEV